MKSYQLPTGTVNHHRNTPLETIGPPSMDPGANLTGRLVSIFSDNATGRDGRRDFGKVADSSTLDQLRLMIQDDAALVESTAKARSLRAAAEGSGPKPGKANRVPKTPEWCVYDDFKATLPAVTWAGVFTGRRTLKTIETHSGLCFTELDEVQDPAAVKTKLSSVPGMVLAYTSSSGSGVHIIWAVEPLPVDANQHRAAWAACVARMGQHGLSAKNDGACKDVSRLAFLPSDPEAVYKPKSGSVPWNMEPAKAPGTTWTPSADQDERLEEALSIMAAGGAGAMDEQLLGVGMTLKSMNHTFEEFDQWAVAAACSCTTDERRARWDSFAARDQSYKAIFGMAKVYGYKHHRKSRAKSTDPKPTMELLPFDEIGLWEAFSRLDVSVRWNSRAQKVELEQEDGWMDMDDRVEAQLRMDISRRFTKRPQSDDEENRGRRVSPWYPNDTSWDRFMLAGMASREADPFLVYLESRPPWDGVERIEGLLSTMFGAPDDVLTRAASKMIFTGPVLRTLEPGAKFDVTPVLQGPQDLGKSHFLQSILPEDHRMEWFSDSLRMSAEPKVRIEATLGRVIAEWPELQGLAQCDLAIMKAFLTRQADIYRPPYHKHVVTIPRRFVVIGTSDEKDDQVLPADPAGNRRFVVARLTRGLNVVAYLDPIRDQLWAEALAWIKARREPGLPIELRSLQAEANELKRKSNEGLENELDRIATNFRVGGSTHVPLADIVGALRHPYENVSEDKIVDALNRRGWTKRRLHGGARRWIVPEKLGGGDRVTGLE